MDFSQPTVLGKTKLKVGRLGVGAGYGAPASAFEEAFDKGCNYFYWTSRKSGMKEAINNIRSQGKRDRLVIAVQSYSRSAHLLESSLEKALKNLSLDFADVFLLGWHNRQPAKRLIDRSLKMREKGLFRFLGMSGHNRPLFPQMAFKGTFDLFHIRYNAAHRGAEREVFAHVEDVGIVTYTATRWGRLLNPRKMPPGETSPTSTDCYRFVLSNPAVHVCLCGPKNTDQMRAALKTLESGPMDETELQRMTKIGDYVHKQRSWF